MNDQSSRPAPEPMTTTINEIAEIAGGPYETPISAGEIARLETRGYFVDLETGAILLDPDQDPTPAQRIQALQAAIQSLTHHAALIDLGVFRHLWPALDQDLATWIRDNEIAPDLAARYYRQYADPRDYREPAALAAGDPYGDAAPQPSQKWQRHKARTAAALAAEAAGEPPRPEEEEEEPGEPWHKWRYTIQWLEANGWTVAGTWTDPDSLIRVTSHAGSVYHTSPARALGFALLEQAGRLERQNGAIRRQAYTMIGDRPEEKTPSQIAGPAIEAGSEIWIDVDGAYTLSRSGDLRRYIIGRDRFANLAHAFRAAAEALRHEYDAGGDQRKAPAAPGYEPMTREQAEEAARQTLASFGQDPTTAKALQWYKTGSTNPPRPTIEISAGWDSDPEYTGYFVPIWNVVEAGHHLDHFDSLIAALEYIKRRRGCPLGASPQWEQLGEISRNRVIKAAAANVVIYDNGEDISAGQPRRQWTIARRHRDQEDQILLHRYDGGAGSTEAGSLGQVIALAYWIALDPHTAGHITPLQAARWIDYLDTWRITYNEADRRFDLAKKTAPATVLRQFAIYEAEKIAPYMKAYDAQQNAARQA